MLKKMFLGVLLLLLAISAWQCGSSTREETASAGLKILREAKIGSVWEMKQVEITLEKEFIVDIKLASGNKVDGYFYLEKGSDIEFEIWGNSLIYRSSPSAPPTEVITSDRFSFTASPEQGQAYYLTFRSSTVPGKEPEKLTIFLEIIYPSNGSIFIPIETK